jgi:hypothetical protein
MLLKFHGITTVPVLSYESKYWTFTKGQIQNVKKAGIGGRRVTDNKQNKDIRE